MHTKSQIFTVCTVSVLLIVFLASYTYAAENFALKTVIAFGADAYQDKPQPIWDTILSFNPDVFLFLGDNVYIDSGNEKIMREKYAKFASIAGYQKLLAKNIPIMATWDDHDYGIDDGGGDFWAKKISKEVFLDFFGEPKDSQRRKQDGVYDAKIFGQENKRVQIIALDIRYSRDNTTMLGEQQWNWLEKQLQKPAEIRIIMSSIQVITKENGWENWMNLPLEREKLFKLIKKTKAGGIIFVSGDRHFGELTAMNAGIGYPLYDLTTGSLNKAIKKFPSEKNLYRIEKNIEVDESFGLITIDWGIINPPQILLEIKDINGNSTVMKKIPLTVLQRGILKILND